MDNFYFYKAIQSTTIQVMNIFNDIKIAKYNSLKQVDKYVNVPIKLANKSKYFYWLYDRKKEKALPVMGMNLTGIEYDASRKSNKFAKIFYKDVDNDISVHYQPTPYNFSYDLIISTLYTIEMDQILEQILPYFDPCVPIKLKFKDVNSTDMNLHVCLTGCSSENTDEYAEDAYRILNWRLTFNVTGYIFRPIGEGNIIKKVETHIYNSDKLMEKVIVDGNDPSNIITTIELGPED